MPSPKKEDKASVIPTEDDLRKTIKEIVQKITDDGDLDKVTTKDTLRMAETKLGKAKGLLSDRALGNKDWTNKILREVMSDFVEDNFLPTARRARSAYQVYCAENKGKLTAAKLKENWKTMSDDDKKSFVETSNKEKAATKAALSERKEKEKKEKEKEKKEKDKAKKSSEKEKVKRKSSDTKEKGDKKQKVDPKKTAISFYMKDQANKDLAMAELKLTSWNGIKCNAWMKKHYATLSNADKKKWEDMEKNQ